MYRVRYDKILVLRMTGILILITLLKIRLNRITNTVQKLSSSHDVSQ